MHLMHETLFFILKHNSPFFHQEKIKYKFLKKEKTKFVKQINKIRFEINPSYVRAFGINPATPHAHIEHGLGVKAKLLKKSVWEKVIQPASAACKVKLLDTGEFNILLKIILTRRLVTVQRPSSFFWTGYFCLTESGHTCLQCQQQQAASRQ